MLTSSLAGDTLTELIGTLKSVTGIPRFDELANSATRVNSGAYCRIQLCSAEPASDKTWEVALVVLQPGESIGAHDHGEYEKPGIVGAVYVVEGVETNRFYHLVDGSLVEDSLQELTAGQSLVLTSELIHSVENRTNQRAISLHAYLHAQGDPRTKKRRF